MAGNGEKNMAGKGETDNNKDGGLKNRLNDINWNYQVARKYEEPNLVNCRISSPVYIVRMLRLRLTKLINR